MKITTDKTVPLTDDLPIPFVGMIKVGPIKVKHMRIRKDLRGWYVMRGRRGRDRVYIQSMNIIAIDGGEPSITFNL